MKIAIAGYGIEGKASAKYWADKGHSITILDENDIQVDRGDFNVVSGADAFNNLAVYDMVIRTASLHPEKLRSAKKIWSATNEFFEKCPAPIIAVTGTKGKGTTASLIAEVLRTAGKDVHLVGNIGVPALGVLPEVSQNDVVVFEMSSFQLWDIERSPSVAVVLMIEPDHQNVHKNMDEYVEAKSRITAFQSSNDTLVYNPFNRYSSEIAKNTKAHTLGYGDEERGGVYVKSNTFFIRSQQICSVDLLQIPGDHNVENACAALTAVLAYDDSTSSADIAKGLRSFMGLPHRLKFIKEVGGVKYYDDNYSSSPGATIAAMRSFQEPEILIVGGYDKGIGFNELARAVEGQPNVKRLIVIGQTRHKIAVALDATSHKGRYELSNETELAPIVARAHELAEAGDVVIMSPACASFDMFKNFADRGEQFIKFVEGL